MKKSDDRLRGLWDISKQTNICIIGIPEGEEREKEAESLFKEIMAENFSNLGEERDIQIQEDQRVLNKMNQRDSHGDTL